MTTGEWLLEESLSAPRRPSHSLRFSRRTARMQVRLTEGDPLSIETPLLAIPVFREEGALFDAAQRADQLLDGALARAKSAGDFRGTDDEALLLYRPGSEGSGPVRFLFLGMGNAEGVDEESIRKLAARAVRQAESRRLTSLALHLPEELGIDSEAAAHAAAEGAVLAAWDFREFRSAAGDADPVSGESSRPVVTTFQLHLDSSQDGEAAARGLRTGVAFGEGENLARLLQSRPGNIATPTHLADTARDLAKDWGFTVRILGPDELADEEMRALLAVSAGSDEEPRLIVLEHRGGVEGEPPLALVGKGLTFDTGGISIKPALGMEEMKFDMSGGAAVLGAMRAVGALDLPLNIVAVVPSSENLISGKAVKPGDVIRARNGKTVEVINTDAEGRLILADALSFVIDHHAPKAVVDCATLTGACVIALGHQAAAVLGNDEGLVDALRAAGDRSGERCWPLPLWKEYRKQLESPVADMKNVGGRPAGAITAALFLAEFVGETPWAHLDIAGTAYGDARGPYHRKGALGFPTRLLLEWLRAQVA
ncbi:MAG: leucyl aminopeptidase [Gemmatimonadota bacterium]